MRAPNAQTHLFKDPSKLTPYEEKLWELKQAGMTSTQIREALGVKSSPAAINSRIKIIREKLEAATWAQ